MYQLNAPSVKSQSCPFGHDKSLRIDIHMGSHISNSPVAIPLNFQESSQGNQTELTPALSIDAPYLAMVPSERPGNTGQSMDTSPYSVQPHQSHTRRYREYTKAAKTPIVTTEKAVGDKDTAQLLCSLPDDFGYSLRNFMVVDPVLDANALYARIAVREGHAMVGHACTLPQQSLKPRDDSERTDQGIHKDYIVGIRWCEAAT
ncbi:uncharacterized protein LAJ45_05042 [Morchella importuna]|uniref:uncharacterized protein n=1 Tax=Morchella importuna TaxID=1174673 RepID=UPI001E8D6EEF|nr:uncharacterized protein LAJ45_05042 [Morchella importuna]KAH8150861.1 hypothetical protein LAJ45_05042 [Morchella importuna]